MRSFFIRSFFVLGNGPHVLGNGSHVFHNSRLGLCHRIINDRMENSIKGRGIGDNLR